MAEINQKIIFNTNAHVIYEALLDEKIHSKFTGSKAKISRKIGGKFETYDGYANGVNLELEKDKKIVQKWRADDWPKSHYSIIEFKLKEVGKKTELNFLQKNIPEEYKDDISKGWIDFYWNPMKEMFKSK